MLGKKKESKKVEKAAPVAEKAVKIEKKAEPKKTGYTPNTCKFG